MPFWTVPRSDESHFPSLKLIIDMLRSDELYSPSTNQVLPLLGQLTSVNARQSEAVTVSLVFPPSRPTLLTPPPLPKGILPPPPPPLQFRSHQETRMTARSN